MKTTMQLLAALAVAATPLVAAAADAGEAAMTKAGCMACHTKDKKLIGPALKDVAAKYKGQDVTAKLMDKVRKGGTGVWGPIPMPPNGADKIDDATLKIAVEYVLKL